MKLDPNKLIRLRMKANEGRPITQEAAAEQCGISLPTYNRAEAGENIHATTGYMIASGFGVDIDDLQIPGLPEPLTEEAAVEVIHELKSQETT